MLRTFQLSVSKVNAESPNRSVDHELPHVSFTPKDEECGIWKSPPNAKCHASFGAQGTTATVGGCGQLVQFSDHLDAGASKMFCADHAKTEEPYLVVNRLRTLHRLAQDPFQYDPFLDSYQHFGLEFPGLGLNPDAHIELK